MSSLPDVGSNCGYPICRTGKRLFHAIARRSADDVVAIQCGVQLGSCVKVFTEFCAKLPEFIERKLAKLHAFFEGEANSVADLLVRSAEGKPFVHEVSGGRHSIQVARLSRFAHAVEIKRECSGEPRHKAE